jgi:uncharacterized membrane protein YkoI
MELSRTKKAAAVGAGVLLVVGIGGGVAIASSDDDATDRPITGSSLDRASRAALAETGGGKVTETEVDDEESYYEVEVTMPDGSQVDVQLDRDFQVVGTKHDGDHGESAGDE